MRPRADRPRRARVALAFAAAAAVALAFVAAGVAARPRLDGALAADVERHHLRSFSRERPCEFESSDRAAVADWVQRSLGYRVDVPSISGATLLGARRCALDGEPAAHLLYRVGDHALTVFVPATGSRARRAAERLAGDTARCTEGPLGDRVCAVAGAQVQLAVSEIEAPRLLALLESDGPR